MILGADVLIVADRFLAHRDAELSASVAVDEAGHCIVSLGILGPANLLELGGEWVLAKGGQIDETTLHEHEHGIVGAELIETGVSLGGVLWICTHSGFQSVDPGSCHLPSVELVELDSGALAHIATVCEGHDRIAQQGRLLDLKHLQIVGPMELDLYGSGGLRWPGSLVVIELNWGRLGFGLLNNGNEIDPVKGRKAKKNLWGFATFGGVCNFRLLLLWGHDGSRYALAFFLFSLFGEVARSFKAVLIFGIQTGDICDDLQMVSTVPYEQGDKVAWVPRDGRAIDPVDGSHWGAEVS